MTADLPWPIDLGYIVCDPCLKAGPDRNHPGCEGTDETKPICGCRCPELATISEEPL